MKYTHSLQKNGWQIHRDQRRLLTFMASLDACIYYWACHEVWWCCNQSAAAAMMGSPGINDACRLAPCVLFNLSAPEALKPATGLRLRL